MPSAERVRHDRRGMTSVGDDEGVTYGDHDHDP